MVKLLSRYATKKEFTGKKIKNFFFPARFPDALIIGGSAGSIKPVCRILREMNADFDFPVFVILHRHKNQQEEFFGSRACLFEKNIIEPDDKQPVLPNTIYVAPANYHLYIDEKDKINLSVDQHCNFSRPCIDLSFYSAAEKYRQGLLAILLSGANKDGAKGMKRVKECGGTLIVQDPDECEVKTMPESALGITEIDHVLSTEKILEFLNNMIRNKK